MQAKHILVCADDFGLHPVVDAAILELADRGRLNAASCLVDGPSFARHAAGLAASGLLCGLHLNFTERLDGEGLFLPLRALLRESWLRRLDPKAVRRQVARQIDLYEAVMGRPPDYVDGHQHVHQFPRIRDALIQELDRRYPRSGPRPWLRCTVAGSQTGVPPAVRMKSRIIEALGARGLRGLARRHGFQLNRALLGVYGFQGGQESYTRLLQRWLAAAREGDLIMCHPAIDAVPGDALGAQRRAEFLAWKSDATGDWLRQYGLLLARTDAAAD